MFFFIDPQLRANNSSMKNPRMNINRPARRNPNTIASAAVALLSVAVLPACEKQPGPAAANTTPHTASSTTDTPNDTPDAAASEGTQTYTVLGIVAQLPEAGPPPKEFKIHHEHIPTFIGKSGEIFVNSDGTPGMRAMVMPFSDLAPGVTLDGISTNDKIEFTFVVRWIEDAAGNRSPRWQVTNITPMPADTEISFDNKPSP